MKKDREEIVVPWIYLHNITQTFSLWVAKCAEWAQSGKKKGQCKKRWEISLVKYILGYFKCSKAISSKEENEETTKSNRMGSDWSICNEVELRNGSEISMAKRNVSLSPVFYYAHPIRVCSSVLYFEHLIPKPIVNDGRVIQVHSLVLYSVSLNPNRWLLLLCSLQYFKIIER